MLNGMFDYLRTVDMIVNVAGICFLVAMGAALVFMLREQP